VTLFKQQSASQKNWWYDRSLWNDQRDLKGQNKCEMKFWHSLISTITAPFSEWWPILKKAIWPPRYAP
jgi:hypothetical protein